MKHSFFNRALWLLIPLLTIFSTSSWGATATWTLVESQPSDWSGEYLIVYNSNCFDGSLTSGFNGNSGHVVTISNKQISCDDSYALIVGDKSNSTYSLKTKSGYYIGRQNNSNGVDNSTTYTSSSLGVTFGTWNNTNKTVKISGVGGRCLGNNSGSWKFFSSSNAYVNVSLYKKGSSCTSLSMGDVTAAPNNGSINLSWAAVDHADSYTVTCINKSTGVAAGTVEGVEGTTTTKTCNITGLTNGTEYTWSVEPVGSGTYCSSNTAATGDVTPNVYYTVTWKADGSADVTTSVADGQKPVFPSAPESCDDESTTFYGWATATWSGKTDDISGETIYTSASDMPAVTGAVTYYAVFCKGSAASTLFTEDFAALTAGSVASPSSSETSTSTLTQFNAMSKVYPAGGVAKLGGGSNTGYLETKQLTAAVGDVLVISFDVKGWTTVEGDIEISGENSSLQSCFTTTDVSYTALQGDENFDSKSVEVTLTKANPYITFATISKRAFLDNIVIAKKGSGSDYLTNCAVCSDTVNVIKGSESGGTFTLSKSGKKPSCGGLVVKVTPTPNEHYRVASVTAGNPVTTGTATVTGPVNGVYTVTYSDNAIGNSTINVTFEAIPQHTITLVPSAPAHGTTSLESAGTTSVTLEEGIICSLWTVPDDCYSLSSITITPADGYSELEANGENKWEIIDITKDLSVAVVYAQRAQYTVTLDAGTGSVAGSTSITQSNCGNITLPAASPSDACATEGWEFAGWSRTKVNVETTSAPVLIPAGSFAPTANETLYAVYKQSSGAGVAHWVKLRDDSKLAEGDSVIIAANGFDDAMSTTQNSNNRGQASITKCASAGNDTLTAISAGVAKFVLTVGSTSGTWSFYDPANTGYLYAASSSANYLKTKSTKDANGSWSISINSGDGVASIVAQGSYTRNTMQYNQSSSLFACYASASQDDLCLYTKAMGSTNTYFSSPSCTPCVSAAASLSSSAISMTTGKNSVITLTSANTSAVTATSSNTEVATVSVSGKNITVNGIAEGEATVIIQQVRDGVDESAHCEVYFEVSISVTTATIEIIEWEREAVTIEYDGDPEASVILGKEVEHGSKDATLATELFFSKYFEAAGEDKLLGIYNGTGRTISLTGYTLETDELNAEPLDLSEFGQTPGEIADREEIIIYRYGSPAYSDTCMNKLEDYEKWKKITWAGMKFSGRHSIGMYKDGVLIDIIGATYNKNVGTHSTGDLVILEKIPSIGNGIKPSWGDESGFNAEDVGDNIKTSDIETNYGLSTNRCLLVRKNTVTSGADAVRLDTTSFNPHTSPAQCAAAFQTLRTEWVGYHVEGTDSEEKARQTCDGMGYVSGFDYSDYYVTMETFSDDTEIGGYGNGDGTYTIPLPHLDTLACRLIRIQLAKDGSVIASSDPKVPIVVDADMSTNSSEFYKHSVDTCKICDVVVRDKATLTKAANGAENDRAELQNITVYSGSHLIVPSGATNFKAKSIVLRSLDDTVSTASFAGGVTFKDKGYRVYHSKRVKQDRWYWMSLPYACSTSKITWQDGTKATIGTDFHLKYYDGAQRAATQQGGCWKEYTGSTIQPGVGYILSVEQRVGHTYRELIFPMDTISEGETTKGVPVDDYGAGESITPNHKGWNLVGNPYMTYYQRNKINAGDKNLPALTVGKLIPHDSIDAENPLRTIHTYTIDVSGGNNAPFITVPKDHGNSEYEQKLVMDYDLPPFISYFVQIGNNTPVATQQYVNFAKADLTTTPSSLLPASYVRKRVEEEEVDPQEAVLVTLRMKNHEQEADETTFIISDQFSADYEIGSDLGKWFGDNYKDYTKPVLYSKANDGNKLVFYSLPDASAEQWIPLGFWGGNVTQPITFSLRRNNRKLDYVKSVMLHDKTQNTYTELLENDYQFAPGSQTKLNGSRFEVKVILNRPKADVPTGTDNIIAGLYAYASGSQKLTVVGLPEKATIWIYDALGRLIINEDTSNYMRTYDVQGTGVYFVRVNGISGQQTLRTIVK